MMIGGAHNGWKASPAVFGNAKGVIMSTSYVIESIGPNTIDRAYTLVRAIGAPINLHEWREICQSAASPRVRDEPPGDREEIVVALNIHGYVKGLSIYEIRDHRTYGRLLDVPFFVVASAADPEGVAAELLTFIHAKCNHSRCSGMRFWSMGPETWKRRFNAEDIQRTDHGLLMPAQPSAAAMEKLLCAHTTGDA
jgi:hypothetical protein